MSLTRGSTQNFTKRAKYTGNSEIVMNETQKLRKLIAFSDQTNSCTPSPRPEAPLQQSSAPLSIREFNKDADFVAFLKQVQIFVTSDKAPAKSHNNFLHENLTGLRS